MSWQATSFLVLGAALALGLVWYERSRPPARVLALVAALAALAVVGRVAFAPFPNIKPTTDIVLFAGYALGGAPGFAVGAVSALVSNIFFAHGPWTPWQMAAWGGVGLAGGGLGAIVRRRWRGRRGEAGEESEPRELGRWPLAAACALAGLGFGLVMDVYMWTLGAEQNAAAFAVISARSLPFNVAHAVGNAVFCLVIGPPLVRALRRHRRRFEVSWPAPRPVGATVVTAAVAVGLGLLAFMSAPAAAHAASATKRAADYLASAQNGDGGFGRGRGQSSGPYMTSWAALGLAGAGRNPADVARGRASALDYLRRNAGSFRDTNDLERAILVAGAAGVSPRRFGGRDLYSALLSRQESNGSFGEGKIDFTTFGILALRAAGESSSSGRVRDAAAWLVDQQRADGGFGANLFSRSSDVDDTGAALQAFIAAGYGRDHASVRRALRFLRSAQTPSGGFPLFPGGAPNAQSTAYAIQGLVAAGQGNGPGVRRGLSYLRSLQAADGSVRFSDRTPSDPTWVTSQVTPALARKAYPLAEVPRRPAPPPRPQPGETSPGGNDRAKRPSRRSAAPQAGPPGAGKGSGGSGAGTGATGRSGNGPGGPGGTGPSGPESTNPSDTPPGASSPSSFPGEISSPIPNLDAKGLDLPTSTKIDPGAGWRAFSDTGAVAAAPKTAPVAARDALRAADQESRSRTGAALPLLGGAALVLLALTAGAARLRRLWAVRRRGST